MLDVKLPAALPLDPAYVPAALANRRYREAVRQSNHPLHLGLALEREDGCICRGDLDLLPPNHATDADTLRFVERHIKFLLWSRGGWKLLIQGPASVCESIQRTYRAGGARAFDADIMQRIYDQPLTVVIVPAGQALPEARSSAMKLGGHLDGCRIGFDLGASDYKLAAVKDGEPVFSTEIPWDPVKQPDPSYHFQRIVDGLKLAASHLPRVDAIGGSSAGAIVANRIKIASLFRSVPPEKFASAVTPIFENIQKVFGVPLVVVNDGDVTALAGALSLKMNAILGVAMGSSEAAGYLDPAGRITGELHELAFAPVDFNPNATPDEWSGDRGVGALYFSQQAVNRLAPAAGFSFPRDLPLPERLKLVQEKADAGDKPAQAVFDTIGTYLGYTIAHYADYYDFKHLLILGRVTSGQGGEVLFATARRTLHEQFPQLAERIQVHVPDEKSRRVGQAVAAASLPALH
ncbi:MAG: ROK family protein [Lentisphaerae bacterium]|nr:ROK family protein [Lentisphaerota bacterium]